MRDLAVLLRSGTRFNTMSLSRDWEINHKTLSRDLEFMRDRLGYEIEFDFAVKSYRLVHAPKPSL